MVKDLFERIQKNKGPLGKWASQAEGYYVFPKLEGELGPRMKFQGKDILNWSLNDYLGLANHPEVRKADTDAAIEYGAAYPMGARMMSGHTNYHEQLERELAEFVMKESAYLLNFGYQGILSTIDQSISYALNKIDGSWIQIPFSNLERPILFHKWAYSPKDRTKVGILVNVIRPFGRASPLLANSMRQEFQFHHSSGDIS